MKRKVEASVDYEELKERFTPHVKSVSVQVDEDFKKKFYMANFASKICSGQDFFQAEFSRD